MATDAKNVVKEGIVFKKGEKFMSGWKERYLILYTDKRLSYFVIDGLELKGSIFIDNIAPSNVAKSAKGNKSDKANYGFHIQTMTRKWEFAVKAVAERDNWIRQIRLTVEGNAKTSTEMANNTKNGYNNSKHTYSNSNDNSNSFADVNQSMPLPNANQSQTQKQSQPQMPAIQNRKSSKSAVVNTNNNQYNYAQYNNHTQYNNQYNYAQYNAYSQQSPQQTTTVTHHSSFSQQQQQNGYNYYQTQWNNNNVSSQKQQSTAPKKAYKAAKSVYTGFKIKRYGHNTRYSHLFSGYIRQICLDSFPLKLQNLCQEYCGYFVIGNMKPFNDSQLLATDELKLEMVRLLCNGMDHYFVNRTELIYKGSRDGMKSESFHAQCDGKGKTVVLLQTQFGNICGGYTNVAWSMDNKYHRDDTAFLFVVQSNHTRNNDGKGRVFRIRESGKKHAVLHCKEYGPTFGFGHDLAVFSLSENNLDTQSCHHSYSFTSHQLLGGWMYCRLSECEVFQIGTQ